MKTELNVWWPMKSSLEQARMTILCYELLAIVSFIKYFRPFLLSCRELTTAPNLAAEDEKPRRPVSSLNGETDFTIQH